MSRGTEMVGPLRIAYFGENGGNSVLRYRALARLGHEVTFFPYLPTLYRNEIGRRYIFRSGGLFDQGLIYRHVKRSLGTSYFDLIVVNQGEFFGPRIVSLLKTRAPRIACYVNDNPFASGISVSRFREFRRAAHLYDVVAIVRASSVPLLNQVGVKKAISVWSSADEIAHAPPPPSASAPELSSEVCFIGTWFPERGPFMKELVDAGINVSIWGANWQKAPEWERLKPHFRGGNVSSPQTYSQIIHSAKVALCLVSLENQDLHTRRSAEIPAIGGVLLAPRTTEHQMMYEEGTEAMFYDDVKDCAAICRQLLDNPDLRDTLRRKGRERVLRSRYLNEDVMRILVSEAMA